MVKLWIPAEIDFAQNYHWLMKNFPPDVRYTLTLRSNTTTSSDTKKKVAFVFFETESLSNPGKGMGIAKM